MVKYFYLLLLQFLLLSSAHGQVTDLNWHALGISEGLSETNNAFIFKDSRGFVWISSVSGLNRYDGSKVKVYLPDKSDPSTLLGANIQSNFFEDPQEDLWFTTFDAIHKYNYAADCFDHYQVMEKPGAPRLGYYIFYLDPDQYLWLLVEYRMVYTFHIPTGTLEFKGDVSLNSIRCFNVTDEGGYLKKILIRGRDWSGTEEVAVNNDRTISSPKMMNEAELMLVRGTRPIIPVGEATYWVLGPHALMKYNVSGKTTRLFPSDEQLECMIQYQDSLLLIGTLSEGLKVFNMRLHQFIEDKGRAGPVNTFGKLLKISYITKDRDGNIWISTDGVGIHFARPEKRKFNTVRFADYGMSQNEIKPLGLFEEKDGTVLCITERDGAFTITQNSHKVDIAVFPPLLGLNKTKVMQVVQDTAERTWISTWSGIYLFPDRHGQLFQVTDSTKIAQSIASSGDGRIYFTPTVPGFYECILHEGVPEVRPIHAIDKKMFFPVMVDYKNRIWLNHYLKEFEIYDPVKYSLLDSLPLKGQFITLNASHDEKKLFIGAYEGLFEIDEATLELRKIHSEETGFPATSIFSLVNDDQGKIWMGHTKGIASLDPVTGVSHAYNHEDGLPLTTYTEAACRLRSGYFYFGTIGGITVFHPDSVKAIQTPAIPQILSLQVNDKDPQDPIVCAQTGATHLAAIHKLVLPYRYNTLSFTIHSLEYSAPEANKITFKMEGLDEDFLEGNNGDRVRYPSMPPGSYRFVMNAFNSDGVINPVPRILEIVIRSPYYKTWWFMTLVALLGFSIVGYIFYLRFSKKLELQQVRLKLYENLHDDVGSRLTAIVLSAEDLEQNEQFSHPKIKAISMIARSIVGNMRRLVWAIDPENDRMTSIIQKINHDKSLILNDGIAFTTTVDERLKNIVLPGEIRYQISSVCNESFTNIAKYAQATKVSVDIRKENKAIKLTITDNGIGFDPEEKQKNTLQGSGYGMANMQRRASRAKGEFKVYSKPGEGTRIEFQFPFHG